MRGMRVGHHPMQQVGAFAAAAMIGRETPEELSQSDLVKIIDEIVVAAMIAARASKDGPGWAWQQILAAAYPNSPAVHPMRTRTDDDTLRQRLYDQFAPGQRLGVPCWTCGEEADARWGKSLLPLADSSKYINSQPAGGQPLCRPCRIALWCMPWGSSYQKGQLITAWSFDLRLQRAMVSVAVDCASATIRERANVAAAPPYDQWWQALVDTPADVELLQWRNDNRTPDLMQRRVDLTVARWAAKHRQAVQQLAEALSIHPLLLIGTTKPLYPVEQGLVADVHRVISADPSAASPELVRAALDLVRLTGGAA